MIRSAYGVSGAVMRGVDPEVSVEIISGYDQKNLTETLGNKSSDPSLNNIPGVIIGADLAINLGINKDDLIYIISPKGMISPIGHVPSMRQYRITGIFNSGMYEYDSAFIFLNIEDARKIMRMGDSVTGIDVWIKDCEKADAVKTELIYNLGTSFSGRDWIQLNSSLFSALKLEKIAMFVILTLIVMVAAFNIASSLIMMVMDKTKDIAILKTLGASNNNIMKVFIWLGTIIGFAGTFTGVGLGILLCAILERWKFIELPAIYAFSSLPVQLEFFDVLTIALSSMAICFFSTLYPSYQAARLEPVEAIRYG
jgi:lipoprotein-releasing system permease protein